MDSMDHCGLKNIEKKQFRRKLFVGKIIFEKRLYAGNDFEMDQLR